MPLVLATSTDIPPNLYQPTIEIVSATAVHIRELMDTLREADRLEIESFGLSANKGLWLSYRRGLYNKCALVNGKVAAVWGLCGTHLGYTGQPWLLTSNEVYKISPLKFAKIYQKEVYKMLELFPLLENYVAVEYEKAIRMLSIVGFDIGEPEKWGKGMFKRFTMERR